MHLRRQAPSRCMASHASANQQPPKGTRQIARWVRGQVETGGEHSRRFDNFPDAPIAAVAQALSSPHPAGVSLQRLSKGLYYRSRETAFGRSWPNPAALRHLAERDKNLFPAGIAAASLLGFTTQTGARGEIATSKSSLPRKLVGTETVIHTRRPEAWQRLTAEEAALLDFLRRAGKTSELSPEETARKTLALCRVPRRFGRFSLLPGRNHRESAPSWAPSAKNSANQRPRSEAAFFSQSIVAF